MTSAMTSAMGPCGAFPADLMSVVASLTSERKHVPHWYLYDTRGSEIFEHSVRTSPTYKNWTRGYSLLWQHARDIVNRMPAHAPATLVELGSGASSKTRLVIDALLERQERLTYIPVDIAKDFIEEVARELEREYRALTVEPFGGLYMDGLRHAAWRPGDKLLLFLGNSLGNAPLDQEAPLLRDIRAQLGDADRLVLGLDMSTDHNTLLKAYSARAQNSLSPFINNFINRLNKDFDGDMDGRRFRDAVDFVQNPPGGATPSYVQKYLQSSADHQVHLGRLGLTLDFPAGEKFYLSEGPNYSCKYTEHQVRRLAERGSFAVQDFWANEEASYCLVCLAPN